LQGYFIKGEIMHITEKAKKYLQEKSIQELTIVEITMRSCCSTEFIPRIILGKKIRKEEIVDIKKFDDIKVYFSRNTEKYMNSGIIDIRTFGNIKALNFLEKSISDT